MNACAQRVAKTEYQGAMLVFLRRSGETWTPEDTKKYYRSLWLTSVWLLVTELCREEMTPKRISKLSYSLFGDYMKVYQKAENFPDTATWDKYQEDTAASKGHNPPENLEHFAGVDIQPTIAQLQPGTPGTPGTPGQAAAKRTAGTMTHIIPPATPLSPVPNTPNSAAKLSADEQAVEFNTYIGRDYLNLNELNTFNAFYEHLHRRPNSSELVAYEHWQNEISKSPPTYVAWQAYIEICKQKTASTPTDPWPTREEFEKYLPVYSNHLMQASKTEPPDFMVEAKISTSRDW
jgi:hypothetical protein